jgi:HK97 family phage major capsid protein
MKPTLESLHQAARVLEGRGMPITASDIMDAQRRGINGDQLISEQFEKMPEAKRGADTRVLHEMQSASGRQFSLVRTLNRLGEGRPLDGFEAEVSQEFSRSLGNRKGEGIWLPRSILESRSMFAGNFAAGGAFVATETAGQVIEKLVAQPVVQMAGATTLEGLTGNLSLPRQTGEGTTEWLAEGAEITDNAIGTDDIVLSPKRVGSLCSFSKQLLIQSSIGIEAFIRNELSRATNMAVDKAALYGSGTAGEPKGVFSLDTSDSGIGTVTFDGAPSWAKVIEFETQLASENAHRGSLKFITSPAVAGKWKVTPKVANYPQFLLENTQANGFDVLKSTLGAGTSHENKVVFGNFSDMIIARWAGVDLVVDPYTLAAKGRVRIVANSLVDIAVRHPESFVVSTDAGNQ